ncbi:MAG: hypothetical protein LEGION0398_MBIBDBAK_01408 [Legionellaceae bacterium]
MPNMVNFDIENIKENTKIIIPVSMGQKLETGEHLKALLEKLQNYNADVTLLICDGLNKFNVGEENAEQQGNDYLKENAETLKNFKIIRWNDFIESKKDLFENKLKEINEKSNETSFFYKKMEKTWEKCLSSQKKENSISYQRNEYAAILCMEDFDMLIYPQKVTTAMSFLFNTFKIHKPTYNAAKIKIDIQKNAVSQITPNTELTLFHNNKKPKHMHIALRSNLEQIQKLFQSSEISLQSKQQFIDEFGNFVNLFNNINTNISTQEKEENDNEQVSPRSPRLKVK